MATQSSREAALERRKALADGGKKAAGRYNNNSGRVRSASDARPTRTNTPVATAADVLEAAASAPAPRAARSLSAPSAAPRSGNVRRVSNPSRDLVLARREALARGGKRASTSKDRTRTDLGVTTVAATSAATAAATTAASEKPCKCQEKPARDSAATLSLSSSAGRGSSAGGASRATARKASAQHNPSRALVLARREALSKRGKSASSSSKSGAAAVARQINPDLNGRDLDLLRHHTQIHIVTGRGAYEAPQKSEQLSRLLSTRGIAHNLDMWGYDVNHDWPWWRRMLPHYVGERLGW